MSKSRIPTWVSLILLGVGLLVVGIPGLFVYMRVTATKVHPDSQKIPSVMESPPLAKWAGAAEQARQTVRTSISENNLAGLSIAVGIDGEIVWTEGFGFADIENGSPVTPSHRFRTGTASIVLTSAAIGLLLDEGQLKLDDEIQKYVPDFPHKQWPVTIRQVMGQVAGFKTEDPDDGVLTSNHCERPADAVALFAKEPLLFQPGTQYCDSTFGWVLLSAVVDAAADTPFATFLNERVLRPLGMVDTFKESVTNPPSDAATEIRREPYLRPDPIAQIRLFLPRGIQRVPVHTVRPGALRHGDQPWQAAASADGSDAANASAIDVGRTDELRARLGPQDRDTGGSPSPGRWPQWPFLG